MRRHARHALVAAVTALALVAPAAAASAKSDHGHGQGQGQGQGQDQSQGQDQGRGHGHGKGVQPTGPVAVTAKVSRGATTLSLSLSLPASVSVRRPATADGGSIAFPITEGRITVLASGTTVSTVTAASIRHVGGVTLTKGATSVTLKNLMIDGLSLSAQVKVSSGSTTRLTIATLTQPSTITVDGRSLQATGITVTLTAPAADALNAVLGTSYSSATVLGTASISTRIVGRPHR